MKKRGGNEKIRGRRMRKGKAEDRVVKFCVIAGYMKC